MGSLKMEAVNELVLVLPTVDPNRGNARFDPELSEANRGSKVVRVLAFLAMECVIPAWYDLILSTLKPGRIPKVIEVYGKPAGAGTTTELASERISRSAGLGNDPPGHAHHVFSTM
ncbi:unnamed protein product [Penicillium camemberti]|uniref:Str. FM013 n=1 Tax=Penicillium camemberti (strain FM 013) TaxID=1429867 RepID=A0A0G4PUM5_PENC3|nr:unnamed protein product [Penicillium camemberti]